MTYTFEVARCPSIENIDAPITAITTPRRLAPPREPPLERPRTPPSPSRSPRPSQAPGSPRPQKRKGPGHRKKDGYGSISIDTYF